MRKGILLSSLLSAAVLLGACGGGPSPIAEHEGSTVYTQVSMWAENDQHLTTNYSAGYHIPPNTQVEIRNSNREAIVMHIPELDRTVRIVNAAQHTEMDIAGIYDRYFGDSPVDLGRFDEQTRDYIKRGEVKEGMSKEAVLLARGYPPTHRTPSTDVNSWTYWHNRFGRNIVHFEDGEVARIEE